MHRHAKRYHEFDAAAVQRVQRVLLEWYDSADRQQRVMPWRKSRPIVSATQQGCGRKQVKFPPLGVCSVGREGAERVAGAACVRGVGLRDHAPADTGADCRGVLLKVDGRNVSRKAARFLNLSFGSSGRPCTISRPLTPRP